MTREEETGYRPFENVLQKIQAKKARGENIDSLKVLWLKFGPRIICKDDMRLVLSYNADEIDDMFSNDIIAYYLLNYFEKKSTIEKIIIYQDDMDDGINTRPYNLLADKFYLNKKARLIPVAGSKYIAAIIPGKTPEILEIYIWNSLEYKETTS